MNIKVEQTADVRELANLNESIQTWHHENYLREFKPFAQDELEKALENLIGSENSFGFIAKHENKSIAYPIGYVRRRQESAFQYEKTVFFIDQIGVLPEYRKSGVGQILMDRTCQLAKRKDIDEVQLDYWSGNQSAEIFFTKNGFTAFKHAMKK